jgi:hypothetical protein
MAAVHGMEPEMGPSEGMGPRGMRQPGLMRGRGVGPALLYSPPAEDMIVERARTMLDGALAWHGNPRLKLGTVEEQRRSTTRWCRGSRFDRATGTFHRID